MPRRPLARRAMRPRRDGAADVVVVGGGCTGLAAAWELAGQGRRVTVLESEAAVGGLAGSFEVGGARLETFYHHWFRSDVDALALVAELGCGDRLQFRDTTTGIYFANGLFRLSKPLDLLRFSPLPVVDRLRLGLLAMRARAVKDWRALEGRTAKEWLIAEGGQRVYDVVWGPLLRGKFGPYADDVGAVWIWSKLKLRGGSRNAKGGEQLVYLRGGFGGLCEEWARLLAARGCTILTGQTARGLTTTNGRVTGVATADRHIAADAVLVTTPLPIAADLFARVAPVAYVEQLRRTKYLANVCMVLELDRSLSDTYWINVNDPHFPFVGVIEHTNFEPATTYGGRHVVYLSKYLPETDPLYAMTAPEMLAYATPHLRRMFPAFRADWVGRAHVWRARYAQPVVTPGYAATIPAFEAPVAGAYLASMAQIYPEDRGTSYAIREGRAAGLRVAQALDVQQARVLRRA